jgi:chromosome segregation ATPase
MPAATQGKVEKLKQVVIRLKATIAQAETEQAETQRILEKLDREEPCAVQSLLNEQLDAALRSIQDQLRSMCVNAVDELSLLETMHTRDLLRAEEERKQLSDQAVALDSKLTTCKGEVAQLQQKLKQKEEECKQAAKAIKQLEEDKQRLDRSAKESQEALQQANKRIITLEEDKQRLGKSAKGSQEAIQQANKRIVALEEERKNPKCSRCGRQMMVNSGETWRNNAKLGRPELAAGTV